MVCYKTESTHVCNAHQKDFLHCPKVNIPIDYSLTYDWSMPKYNTLRKTNIHYRSETNVSKIHFVLLNIYTDSLKKIMLWLYIVIAVWLSSVFNSKNISRYPSQVKISVKRKRKLFLGQNIMLDNGWLLGCFEV